MSQPASELMKTPLNSVHRRMGARMVDFGGWDMPVQYSGILDEHAAVRTAVGLFDVSHMGEIEIRGPEALPLVNYVSCNDAGKLKEGQAQYSGLLYQHGGFVDDILVHKVDDDHFFLCVNASNQVKDYEYIGSIAGGSTPPVPPDAVPEQVAAAAEEVTAPAPSQHQGTFKATVEFASERYAQIAVQGPKAIPTLQKLTPSPLETIRYYWFVDGEVGGVPARIARTGYTGEDGFEVYVAPERAEAVWDALMEAGSGFGIRPCGLGARNTLRLEAAMALYGHEIDASITPLEANLNWIVKFDKPDFLGKAALEKQKREGIKRRLTGFVMEGRGIGRDGYEVLLDGQPAGWVTSGGPSPTLNRNIGMCYLPVEAAQPERAIAVSVRNQPVPAVTAPTPFYKRAK